METKKVLNQLIECLNNKNIQTELLPDAKEGIEIGELKNNKIVLNTKSRDELSLVFTIAHLYGHYTQFQDYEKYKHLVEEVEKPVPLKLTNEFKSAFWEYEKEAFSIGKGLMQEVTMFDDELENKYQTFMETDFEHFWDYLMSGRNEDVKSFNERLEKNYKKINNKRVPLKAVYANHVNSNTPNIQVTVF
jgi:hypothetical protein